MCCYYRVVVAEAVRTGHILAPARRAAVVQEAASAVSGLDQWIPNIYIRASNEGPLTEWAAISKRLC